MAPPAAFGGLRCSGCCEPVQMQSEQHDRACPVLHFMPATLGLPGSCRRKGLASPRRWQ